MKAIVYHGKGDVRFNPAYPVPCISHPSEVKIKIDYCGLGGAEIHEYSESPLFFVHPRNEISHKGPIQVMGREMCGEVVEIGPDVSSVKVGDKVVVDATGTCKDRYRFPNAPNFGKEECDACAAGVHNACAYMCFTGLSFGDGGFAEYAVLGDAHLVKYDSKVIPTGIAALVEPLAVAWHGVSMSHFKSGDSALVIGAGPIGLCTLLALKARGAGNIVAVETEAMRREVAAKLGVKLVDPTPYQDNKLVEHLNSLSEEGFGFQHTFDCSGVPETFNISVKCLKPTGVATNLALWPNRALPFFPMEITLHEKFITGSLCYVRKDLEDVIGAFEAGSIDPREVKLLVTDVVVLEKGVTKGFKELLNHKKDHIKILLTPSKA